MGEKKMKVAIYNGRIPATTFIERLIEGVAKTGVVVQLYGEVCEPVSYYNPNVRTYGWKGKFGRWSLYFKYLPLLLLFRPKEVIALWKNYRPQNLRIKLFKFSQFLPVLWHKPDVFHVQWAKSLKDWYWVRHFGMRLVVSLRGSQLNYAPLVEENTAELYRIYFPMVNGFHAVSHAIKCKAQLYGASVESARVVYSGLDARDFAFYPDKPKRNKLHILSVGRAHWIKGYTYALDACQMLKGKIDFQYAIIGGFCQEHAFHVNDAELEGQVTLTGALPFEEVQRHMQESDVLLLPSVEEGIANVVLEAMALGTPVISTDCGGMAEVIEDGVNGILVPTRDTQALAEALMRFAVLSPEERKRLALAARQTIEQRFQQKQMVDKMIALYREVMAKGGLEGSMKYKKETVSLVRHDNLGKPV
ncbi:MAG: glycosyltransferase [Bacteroidetes bacterium]|nr:MAG: glycosyltransferase [Bacteroidota bacterium]